MSFTLNDIALLLIALVAGLILGLMMSGRGKYRRLWQDEQAVHRAAIKDRDMRIDAANARLTELEERSPPVDRRTANAVPADMAGRDDLKQVRGISKAQEIAMNEFGYQRYSQIVALDGEQETALEARLGLTPGTIAREEWREQARLLDRDRADAPVGRFATPI